MSNAIYNLTPNYDGGQNTRYPLGNKPNSATPDTPSLVAYGTITQTVMGVTWAQTGIVTGFVIEQWIYGTSSAWTQVATPAASARAWQATGLPIGTNVGHRIKAVNGSQESDWAPEIWAYTNRPATGDTDISQIRWSADWSKELDGAELRDSNDYGMWNVYNGRVSSQKLFQGRKTMKEVCDWGSAEHFGTGFGRSISDIPYGEAGAEQWFRVWVYHDPGFSWTTDSGTRKNMRMREQKASGGYASGSNDSNVIWPYANNGAQPGAIRLAREGALIGPDSGGWNIDPNGFMQYQTGVWECVEFYVKAGFTNTSGVMKYWKNGTLVGEVPQCKTVVNADGALRDFLFVSNWNRGLDKVCTYWWCAPAIALRNSTTDDTPHMARDGSGFPYIGEAI